MADKIESLIRQAAAERIAHRKLGRAIEAAAGAIRLVALMDCLWIIDPARAKAVSDRLRDL